MSHAKFTRTNLSFTDVDIDPMSSRKAKRRLSDNGDDAAPDKKRRTEDDPNQANQGLKANVAPCKIGSENTIFEKLSPTFEDINGASRLVVL